MSAKDSVQAELKAIFGTRVAPKTSLHAADTTAFTPEAWSVDIRHTCRQVANCRSCPVVGAKTNEGEPW